MRKRIRPINIILGIIGLLAVAMIVIVLLPGGGTITAEIDNVEFQNSGLEARVDVTVKNTGWKPVLFPSYEITITDESGELAGKRLYTVGAVLWGNKEINYKQVIVQFTRSSTRGDVEVEASGLVF